jgi:predicted methyltransferase
MDQGVYKLLRTLASRTPRAPDEIVRTSGEAKSVLANLRETQPTWIEVSDTGLRASKEGLAALALELVARTRGEDVTDEAWAAKWAPLAARRGTPKHELDQVFATKASVLTRARKLVADGDVQRGLCFLGDDDLTSLGTALLELDKPLTVLDIDDAMLGVISEGAKEAGLSIETVSHDLREPIPAKLRGRFGCVMTDPPYAPEGFALFVSRALELLRPDGRLYVLFGWSRRAPDRGLEKQRMLLDAGMLIEEMIPDFSSYEGAESIGGKSALFVCARTPQSKALIEGRDDREALYTRRSPRRKKK